MIDQTHQWYVLMTRNKSEFTCIDKLEEQGIECFTPWHYTYRKWSDRTRRKKEAKFPAYIFAKISCKELEGLNSCKPHVTILKRGRIHDPIPIKIIEGLKQIVDQSGNFSIRNRLLQKGQRVRIIDGPFLGQYAEVYGYNGNRQAFLRIGEAGLSVEVPIQMVGNNMILQNDR